MIGRSRLDVMGLCVMGVAIVGWACLVGCRSPEPEPPVEKVEEPEVAKPGPPTEATKAGATKPAAEPPKEVGKPEVAKPKPQPPERAKQTALRKAVVDALSVGTPEDIKADFLSRFDRLFSTPASPQAVLQPKRVPLLILAGKNLHVFDLPIFLATVECCRQNGIDPFPVRVVRSGESSADCLGQLKPQPQYAMMVWAEPGVVRWGVQATFAYLSVRDVPTSTKLEQSMLLAMVGVSEGKDSHGHLASGMLPIFLRNVSGSSALGKLQEALHGDVIAKKLKQCAGLSDVNVLRPEAGEKGAGQSTKTEIGIRAGQFTVYFDAPEGSPDRCWELRGRPWKAELAAGAYAIYIHDRATGQNHRMERTELKADKGYVLLK